MASCTATETALAAAALEAVRRMRRCLVSDRAVSDGPIGARNRSSQASSRRRTARIDDVITERFPMSPAHSSDTASSDCRGDGVGHVLAHGISQPGIHADEQALVHDDVGTRQFAHDPQGRGAGLSSL